MSKSIQELQIIIKRQLLRIAELEEEIDINGRGVTDQADRPIINIDREKTELMYLALLRQDNEIRMWKRQAESWRGFANDALQEVAKRGAKRAEHDLVYAAWRDNVMGRCAYDIDQHKPVSVADLLDWLKKAKPEAGRDGWLDQLRGVALEFGFELQHDGSPDGTFHWAPSPTKTAIAG